MLRLNFICNNSQESISEQNARLDVAANGVWGGRFEHRFFDVRVFNPFAMDTLLATKT